MVSVKPKMSFRLEIGWPDWTRTSDPVINSHLLYQLSYRPL